MSKNTNLSFLTDYITADITNGRIGINNASPAYSFDVTGIARTSTSTYLATASGSVGIGTTSPVKTLEVRGTLAISNSATSYWYMDRDDSDGRFKIVTDTDSEKFTITTAGNVGIGTSSPNFKLHISTGTTTSITEPTAGSYGLYIQQNTSGSTGGLYIQDGASNSGNSIYVGDNNGAARFIVNTDGNVGIGTSSPSSILHAAQSNAGNVAISVQNINGSYNSQYRWLNSSSTQVAAITWIQSASSLRFNNNGNDALEITSGGRVLMSTQANGGGSGILEVTNSGGAFADNGPSITCVKSSSTTSSSARFMQFYASNGGQPMGGIVGNGAENVQFATLSDIRDKENIQPIYGSLNKIIALNPVEFNWKKSKEHVKAGFIAQQVEEVFPEYVLDNFANEGDEPRKAITGGLTSGIIVHLVKAIQELSAEITILKNK
jgi:hypothetical protein